MKAITMLQFRQDSESIIGLLKRGQRLLLTYRGKPVARLEPVRTKKLHAREDPVFQICQLAEPSPMGPLDHSKIDSIVYEAP